MSWGFPKPFDKIEHLTCDVEPQLVSLATVPSRFAASAFASPCDAGLLGKSAQRSRFFDLPRAVRQDHSPLKEPARVHNHTMSAQSQPVELSAFARWAEKAARL